MEDVIKKYIVIQQDWRSIPGRNLRKKISSLTKVIDGIIKEKKLYRLQDPEGFVTLDSSNKLLINVTLDGIGDSWQEHCDDYPTAGPRYEDIIWHDGGYITEEDFVPAEIQLETLCDELDERYSSHYYFGFDESDDPKNGELNGEKIIA